MKPLNECSGCGEDFSSLNAFDRHRAGKYLQKGPSEYYGDPEDWTPDLGRRCLTTEELGGLGLVLDDSGRWCVPISEKQQAGLERLRMAA